MPSSLPRTPRPTDALADPGFLFALANERHTDHPPVAAWFDRQAAGFRLRVCRMVQISFLRLLTHPAAMDGSPLSAPDAWTLYAGLLADPSIGFHHEPPQLARTWLTLARDAGARPSVLYLAAFAIESGLAVVSLDSAYSGIPGLHANIVTA